MPGAVERIAQDLAAIDAAAVVIAPDFRAAYKNYLNVLGKAVEKQLVLAIYHICTQGYPEAFLRLSNTQRQHLQQSLRQLVQKTQAQLQAQLYVPLAAEEVAPAEGDHTVPLPSAKTGSLKVSHEFFEILAQESGKLDETLVLEAQDLEATIFPPDDSADTDLSLEDPPNSSSPADDPPDKTVVSPDSNADPLTEVDPPLTEIDRLAQWRDSLEKAIVTILQLASRNANILLHKTNLLPQQLPEPILEAVSKADATTESVNSPPNLMTLLVEAENSKGTERSSVMKIVAVRLRLMEIELSDSALAIGRKQLRNLSSQLKALHKKYKKKQRELSVAEAEALWHSSWLEEQ